MSRPANTVARSFGAGLALLLAAAALPSVASAQNPLIARGQEEYQELLYQEALQTLSAALVRAGNSNAEMATAYRLLAFTYLALQREEEAAGAYRHMLPLEPDFEPGEGVSPRIRSFFADVRAAWEAEGRPGSGPPPPISIQHRSPAEAVPGEEVTLSAEVEDPASRVARLVLAYRQGTQRVFTRLDTQPAGGSLSATIPGTDVAPPLVEYYFEAVDDAGLPLAARGDVAAPLRIAVPEPGGNEIWEEWWFWTIIGVVVAGGIVASVVIADELSRPTQTPTGTLVITID